MKYAPYHLDAPRRELALQGIHAACAGRQWLLNAAHVREKHIHAIIDADCDGDVVLQALKAHASKRLNGSESERPRWARGGSARQLRDVESRRRAVRYVVVNQAEPMALFVADERAPYCRAS